MKGHQEVGYVENFYISKKKKGEKKHHHHQHAHTEPLYGAHLWVVHSIHTRHPFLPVNWHWSQVETYLTLTHHWIQSRNKKEHGWKTKNFGVIESWVMWISWVLLFFRIILIYDETFQPLSTNDKHGSRWAHELDHTWTICCHLMGECS